jgi:hypothetical protein
MACDVLISYSRAVDAALAAALIPITRFSARWARPEVKP